MRSGAVPCRIRVFSQNEPGACENGSSTSGKLRLPIFSLDGRECVAVPVFPRPVPGRGGCSHGRSSFLAAPVRCIRHRRRGGPLFCQEAGSGCQTRPLRLSWHHARLLRLRRSRGERPCRPPEDAAWSLFFPRSVGFGPVASPPSGALVIAPSMLCHSQSM